MSVGIKVSANKFAFLHVHDSSDENDVDDPAVSQLKKLDNKSKPNQTTGNSSKKKSRRRKKKQTVSTSSDTNKNNGIKGNQMQQWIQHDQDLVDDLYNEDLKRAIELSRVEQEMFENMKSQMQNDIKSIQQSSSFQDDDNEPMSSIPPAIKKERKKKTLKTISLEEFRQHVEDTLPLQKEEDERKKEHAISSISAPNFFDEVDKQANNIKRNEEAREKFHNLQEKEIGKRKQDKKTNKRDQQASEEKDQIIKKLNGKITEWEEQFKHVKKRNKQLLMMLQQGEMKDKSELLLEIERLCVIRDELTEEVSSLNKNLEQERSRSRKLKDELSKFQTKKSREDQQTR